MLTLLLILIYISFISLGLPDALLGSAWPVMGGALGVPLSWAGILSMIVSGGTIISSILSDRMIRRFGTGTITTVSVGMTAAALLGISVAPGFFWLCLLAVPLGLGAGTVDAALNNFVALRYKAIHMNWLHCFWGVGATIGPVMMSLTLMLDEGWRQGYRRVGLIQTALVVLLILSLPVWKKVGRTDPVTAQAGRALSIREVVALPCAKDTLVMFLGYCALESTTGLWGSTFLVSTRGIDPKTAAQWVSFYFFGIMAGRFICGLISMKMSNRKLIRLGLIVMAAGVFLLFLGPVRILMMSAFILIGLGCAPIYPAIMHDTPDRFGKDKAQSVMGIQMASAYIGATFMPPIFGLIAQYISPSLFPIYLTLLAAVMIVLSERVNRKLAVRKITE